MYIQAEQLNSPAVSVFLLLGMYIQIQAKQPDRPIRWEQFASSIKNWDTPAFTLPGGTLWQPKSALLSPRS
jgi:hypothetical protein